MAVIKDIGCVMAEVESPPERYLQRSFCILEVYGALEGGAQLLINGGGCNLIVLKMADGTEQLSTMEADLDAPPLAVDCAAAQTRNPEDKQAIDDYVRRTIGFDRMNAKVLEAMVVGTRKRQAALDDF